MNNRPTWADHALNIALAATLRSEDPYCQVGACLLDRDGVVLGVGYNGAPSKVDVDWNDRDARRPYVIHAEANALRHTTPSLAAGGLMAMSHYPCAPCCTLLRSYGVLRAVWLYAPDWDRYPPLEPSFLNTLGLRLTRIDGVPDDPEAGEADQGSQRLIDGIAAINYLYSNPGSTARDCYHLFPNRSASSTSSLLCDMKKRGYLTRKQLGTQDAAGRFIYAWHYFVTESGLEWATK